MMSSAPSASAVAGPTLVPAAGRSQSSNKISTTRDQPSETDESWLEDWELLTELEDWELLTLPSDRWPASAAAGPEGMVASTGPVEAARARPKPPAPKPPGPAPAPVRPPNLKESCSQHVPSSSTAHVAAAGPEGMIASTGPVEAAHARPKPPAPKPPGPVPPAPVRPANLKESCSCCQHVPSKAPPPGLR